MDTGKEYSTPEELWKGEADPDGSHNTWYQKAVEYWDNAEATYNGVLGGYGYTSDIDVRDSRVLLLKAMKKHLEEASMGKRKLVAMDCGAGVGRVSEQLLLHHFAEVDLLEPSEHLLKTAEKNLVPEKLRKLHVPSDHRAVNFYLAGLQQHKFEPARYDCIWIQWCLLYLTDMDFVTLFQGVASGLKPDGLVFVKENICREGFVKDDEDNSLTRSNAYMMQLFEQAHMQVLYSIKQRNFPKELFEVRMYCLRPRSRSPSQNQTQEAQPAQQENSDVSMDVKSSTATA